MWASQYAFIVANGGHTGDFSGIRTKKGETLSFNKYPVNIFRSSTFTRKCQSFNFRFCNATVLLRWSLQYGRRWLQFPKNRCSIQGYVTLAVVDSINERCLQWIGRERKLTLIIKLTNLRYDKTWKKDQAYTDIVLKTLQSCYG